MSYICKIKLAGVNNLSDARYAAAAGFDYISFCFDETHPAFIPPVKAKEIIDWTSGSFITGEFSNHSIEEINQIAELLDLDLIEVKNTLFPDEIAQLNKTVIKYIDANNFDEQSLQKELAAYATVCAAFTVILPQQANKFFSAIKELSANYDIFIGGTEDAEMLKQWLLSTNAKGVHITGSNEEVAGIKDFEQLHLFTEIFSA